MAGSASIQGPSGPLRFGPGGRFELRPAEYRLLVDGQPAALGGRALDLLMVLAARLHEVVTKQELLDTVWRGLVVEENNLRVQVNALRRVLGESAIATVPGRGYRLSVALHAGTEAAAAAPGSGAGAGTEPRLFGRAGDLARLEGLLRAGNGCFTLVGTAGVGKSSLARAALRRWSGRASWVDLAPLSQGREVDGAIARSLDMHADGGNPFKQVRRVLEGDAAPRLLVLDNAEHLVERCAEWASQLQDSARILVTSQLALGVGGEQVLRIQPLPVGDGARADGDGAMALLVDRICAADSRFRLSAESQPLLGAVCRQLDGLPLALEMAAARVPLMGLRAVHDALAERFALLSRGRRDSPARHRTLQDALAWSYGLLAPSEQRLFRTLGVFAGGFTLELAVSMNADEHVGRWDVVDGLAALVERSLVSVSGEDPPRYRLLETMRAFALARLASPGPDDAADEGPSARRRHAAAVLALFAGGNDRMNECLAEMENAREAFAWAREHDLAAAAQLSMGAARVIGFTVWRQEVTEWMLALQPAMEQPPGQALPLPLRAGWWRMLAYVLLVRRDRAGRPAARQAVALCRQLDQPGELQTALADLVRSITEPGPELDAACAELRQSTAAGVESPRVEMRVHGALAEAARVRGDYAELLACREQELRLAREAGHHLMAQAAETNVCAALIELGRHHEAAERAQALLQRLEAAGDDNNANLPWALLMLGQSLLASRRLDEAGAVVPRLLAAERRFGTTIAWPCILPLLVAQGRLDAAGRLLGYVRGLWKRSPDSQDLGEREALDEVSAAVRAGLGDEAAATLAAEGAALSDEAAAALAEQPRPGSA